MIAMEALDSLLVSCHAQSLNLFVESFLRMVQKLLECDEPDLQCLATSSVSRLQLGCCFKYSHDSLPKKGEIPLRKIEIEHINLKKANYMYLIKNKLIKHCMYCNNH